MGIFHFPRTGKCVENVWKPLVVQRSRVGQRKEMPCFLAFFSCLRWENSLLSAILPNAVIPTHFQVVAVRLSCKKWYFFLYLSVFYTINHLDIYRYVYYTYMFWWSPYFFDEKKPKKTTTFSFGKYRLYEISAHSCDCRWDFVEDILF